ncbi:leukotoxin LktA family filamentous adhesin [bacterium]|nr:leukotoxin LktA family filamentous adhesin [bacterium]
MNKKKLILVAIAAALSVSGAQASNITGVTPTGNTYNINPEKINGDVGYRKYDNFTLTQGDIANLIFKGQKGGQDRNIEAFINLVKNGVNINGVLNSMRDGKFYDGHVIFMTPGGFIVGSSGVLNVGSLSVATPSTTKYNSLIDDYDAKYYKNIDQVSKIKQDSNAEINIKGKVLARSGVDLRGANVNISGDILNGIKNSSILSSQEQADALFNSLVNTQGLTGANDLVADKNSIILIKSSKDGGLNVSGNVVNYKGETYLTNNGTGGLQVNGGVYGSELTRLYNTKGDLNIKSTGNLVSDKQAIVLNKGKDLLLANGSNVAADKVEIYNYGTGKLGAAGDIAANGTLAVKNVTGSGMTLEGLLINLSGQTALNNYKGTMLVNGEINNNGNMGIINRGDGLSITKNADITNVGKLKIANTGNNGTTIVGKIDNTGETRIYNDAGKLNLATDSSKTTAATITNRDGKLYIIGRNDSTGIVASSASVISNENGPLVIRNHSKSISNDTRGLDLQGTITSKNGTVAINNDSGNMYVSGNINVDGGNLGIINRSRGGDMTLASNGKINSQNGNVNIKNYGQGDMEFNSELSHTGRVNVLANSGALNLGATVHNNSGKLGENGGFYAAARQNGTGINVTSTFVVDGNGEVLIKNISGQNGLRYNGTINTTNNQAALVNKVGSMEVSGKITTTGAPIIISNQGGSLTVLNSTELNSGTEGTLVNTGNQKAVIGSKATLNNVKTYEKVKTTTVAKSRKK